MNCNNSLLSLKGESRPFYPSPWRAPGRGSQLGRGGNGKGKNIMTVDQKQLFSKLARGESLEGVEIGDIDFAGYCFKKRLNFRGATLTGKTVFQGTKFLNGANSNQRL